MASATRPRGTSGVGFDEMLRCRTLGHQWDDFYPTSLAPPSFGWRLSLRCARCSTERHDIISHAQGEVLSREYRYVDGYQQGRDERLDRPELRKALYERIRAKLPQAALASDVTDISTKRKANTA